MFQLGPEHGPSLLDRFWEAGPMAKVVLAILIFFSLGSWAVHDRSWVRLRRAAQQSEKFLEAFHRSQRSARSCQAGKLRASPLVGSSRPATPRSTASIKAQAPRGRPQGLPYTSITALQRTLAARPTWSCKNIAA